MWHRFFKRREGQATLSLVLLVGGIVMEIAVAGTFVAYFLSSSAFGDRAAAIAFSAADAGLFDAKLRIMRDADITKISPVEYTIPVGSATTVVHIDQPTQTAESKIYRIASVGKSGGRERTLTTTIAVHMHTGSVSGGAVREVTSNTP